MSTAYTVQRGDNLSIIARRHGLRSWRDIYFHPENEAFRRLRPNPNLIYAGDVVLIPDVGTGSPTPPRPGSPTELERDLEAYLMRKRQRDAITHVAGRSGLVLLGETHVGKRQKANFLAGVANRLARHTPAFHASEHFMNDPRTQVAIQNYVFASSGASLSRARRLLPDAVRPFEPILDAARQAPGHRYAIIASDTFAQGEDPRHNGIHASFNASIVRHNRLHGMNQLNRLRKGNFLLGAAHAARRHVLGRATPTTCMLLIRDGWPVHVIRLTVNVVGGMTPGGAITAGEGIDLEPLDGSGAAFDLLPILNRVAGGSPFYADLRETGSPFARVKSAAEGNNPFSELFDEILHLPSP